MSALDVVGESLAAAAGMFWETLWALVLGFVLSGAVQAFVSRDRMQRSLGDNRPSTVAKAGLYGAISSSCSYAASALAKTLFARGADFTAAQAFMFASTNLVVELGIVLWLLIGWQFAAAELVGGVLMIVLLRLVLPRVVSADDVDQARQRLHTGRGSASGHDQHSDHRQGQDDVRVRAGWRSRQGWATASGYTVSDLTMLRKELVIGFVVAGFADAAVPVEFWRSLFLTGHGFWSSLENVLLGPFLAIISFVCSIGNVPLAAALWDGGISFGGTVAFVFADLIALPLLLIYRKYYGTRLTLKLLGVFWATMAAAGLATEYLFKAVTIAPPAAHGDRTMVGRDVFGWNYTTVLDLAALVGFALVYWLYRNRDRFGGAAGFAKDPVCGMQVEVAHAPARTTLDGRDVYFCSDHCLHRFQASPGRFATSGSTEPGHPEVSHDAAGMPEPETLIDPVCGMTVDAGSPHRHSYARRDFAFCAAGCRERFSQSPLQYLTEAPDPVCGMDVTVATATITADVDERRYLFCGAGCRERFLENPTAFLLPMVAQQ